MHIWDAMNLLKTIAFVVDHFADAPAADAEEFLNAALMHLKSYQIDGRMLRTDAANFSASGLKRQDNDLIVIESAEAAAAFQTRNESGAFTFARCRMAPASHQLSVKYCVRCWRY
jgi:hypothetical protein